MEIKWIFVESWYDEMEDIHWDEYGKNDFIGCPLCDEAIFSIPESRVNDTEGRYD